jgi:hypothetical protein
MESKSMKGYRLTLLASVSSLTLLACNPCGDAASIAKMNMIGKSKRYVASCMGAPVKKTKVEGLELWSYQSGGQTVGQSDSSIYGSDNYARSSTRSSSKRYKCKLSIVFDKHKVESVNFIGRSAGGRECYFALENCLPADLRVKGWQAQMC